jgi:hypothetical protein
LLLRPHEKAKAKKKSSHEDSHRERRGADRYFDSGVDFILQVEHAHSIGWSRRSRWLTPPGRAEEKADPDRDDQRRHRSRPQCLLEALSQVLADLLRSIDGILPFVADDIFKTLPDALNTPLDLVDRFAAGVARDIGHLFAQPRDVIAKPLHVAPDVGDGRRRTTSSRCHEHLHEHRK